jgi:hypothetical protein
VEKFAEQVTQQLANDINNAANYKLASLQSVYNEIKSNPEARRALLGAGLGALSFGALGNIAASPDTMYDHGMIGGQVNHKPYPAYEGQAPLPWYRNPRGKILSTALGGLAGAGLGFGAGLAF